MKKDGDLTEYMSALKDNNGNVWIVMYGAGVWKYKPSTSLSASGNKIIHYPVKEGNTIFTLYSIFKDHKGDIWLGTHSAGPYKFNGYSFEKFVP